MTDQKEIKIPEIPQIIDVSYIKKQLISIQNEPSIAKAFLNGLKDRFRSRQQRKIIVDLEEWYRVISVGLRAQTQAYNDQLDLEMAKDPKIKELKKLDTRLALQESIARRKANIKKYKQGEEKAGEKTKGPPKITSKDVRQRKVNALKREIDDLKAIDQTKYQALQDIEKQEAAEIEIIMKDTFVGEKEKDVKICEIRKRYARNRDQIKKM